MGYIKDFMEYIGVEPKDIPKAIVMYKGIGYVIGVGIIGYCCWRRPIKMFYRSNQGQKFVHWLQNKYPNGYNKTYNFIMTKSDKVASFKFMQWLANRINISSKRLTMGIAESLIVGKLLLIVTVPLQSIIVYLLIANKRKGDEQE